MPYINVSTSAKIEDKKKLLEEISILVTSLTNKTKRFVMGKLDNNLEFSKNRIEKFYREFYLSEALRLSQTAYSPN